MHHTDIPNSVPPSRSNSFILILPIHLGASLRPMLTLLTEETHIQTRDRETGMRSGRKIPTQPRMYHVFMERKKGQAGNSGNHQSNTLLNMLQLLWSGFPTHTPPPVELFNQAYTAQRTRTPHHHFCLSLGQQPHRVYYLYDERTVRSKRWFCTSSVPKKEG